MTMPRYEYKREDGTTFETVQRMDDDSLTECPETGQAVKRIVTGGIQTQIKNKPVPMSDQENREAKAREEKTTTLGEYSNIMKRQQRKWKEKQRDKE